MRRNLFFSFFLILGLGFAMSSCAPGVYAGASVGSPYPYGYGGGYGYGYGPRYYAPRPIIVQPRPYYRGGGYHGDGGFRGGNGYRGGGGGYYGGGRRGGR